MLLEKEAITKEAIFPLRKRAFRKNFGDVVLLFFRYNRSEKINVIMTTKLEIHSKTLRRRWFQRTYIEQFFRFSKHILKIQESKSTDVFEFDRKVYINFLKVLVCQIFTAFCRKNYKMFKKWSFQKIRKHLIYDQIEQVFLKKILFNYDDLLQSMIGIT
jgi:hypothetical protein